MKGFFYGSATALITPFNETSVNYDVLGELIEYQIAGGTDAIIFLGTTGEPSTMSFEEEHILMDYAVKKVNHRVKVIFGCGSNNTADAVMTAKAAERFGADGVSYHKCDDEHFEVSLVLDVSDRFFSWLCGFGKDAKLVSPPSLVEKFSNHLDEIKNQY